MEHLYLNEEASIESEMRLLPLICERPASHARGYFICVKYVKRAGFRTNTNIIFLGCSVMTT